VGIVVIPGRNAKKNQTKDLPGSDRCLKAECRTRPKVGPLCGKHAQYGNWDGPEDIGQLSDDGWQWIMQQARQANEPPFHLARRALRCQAAVSRADSLELLSIPGWARWRLQAPFVADEFVTALADPQRPVEDRLAVAASAVNYDVPAAACKLLVEDPDASVRKTLGRGFIPEPFQRVLIEDDDPEVAAAALHMETFDMMLSRSDVNTRLRLPTSPVARRRFGQLVSADPHLARWYDRVPLETVPSLRILPGFERIRQQVIGFLSYWSPTIPARDLAIRLFNDGWDGTPKALLDSACEFEGVKPLTARRSRTSATS
jgi:hypothetical protein